MILILCPINKVHKKDIIDVLFNKILFMSSLKMNDDLDKILHLSIKLVVLQNLKECYIKENTSSNNQETRNFRSCCILDELKLILDALEPYIVWLAQVEEGVIKCPSAPKQGIRHMVADFEDIYGLVLEESEKKEARLKLIELERSMFNET